MKFVQDSFLRFQQKLIVIFLGKKNLLRLVLNKQNSN